MLSLLFEEVCSGKKIIQVKPVDPLFHLKSKNKEGTNWLKIKWKFIIMEDSKWKLEGKFCYLLIGTFKIN